MIRPIIPHTFLPYKLIYLWTLYKLQFIYTYSFEFLPEDSKYMCKLHLSPIKQDEAVNVMFKYEPLTCTDGGYLYCCFEIDPACC